jgi:eukaryotic-like serine/threonine-protein kinase
VPEESKAKAPQPFGPFVLERRIAVGGSAEVFLARPKLGNLPAPRLVVKRLLRSVREGGEFDALEREAELHRAVKHANVVDVYGAGMVGEEPYLALEYVDGVDLYRLLRRAESEQRRFPPGLAAHIAREVAEALTAVHGARDSEGNGLHIVHRDVTPSNILLSSDGSVKLGDFGIARFEHRLKPTQHSGGGLKGKFGYLSPEQVAGEPSDHRADLFALTAVFGEMLIGERVFPGSGQLAVLLAIRDVNIEPLRRGSGMFAPGMLAVCERGLARDPDDRYADAGEFAQALSAFEKPSREELKKTLAEWVMWAKDSSELAKRIEGQVRDSVQRMQAVRTRSSGAIPAVRPPSQTSVVAQRPDSLPAAGSRIKRTDGHVLDDVSFAKLIEMIATGDLGADDEVALMGVDFKPIRELTELARHLLPSTTATTSRIFEPGVPDYQALLRDTSMLEVLAHMRQKGETGALFVERSKSMGASVRKELYLNNGRLLHVASSDREELLGEYLVRRGRLSREQLDAALGSLQKFGGRLGDTLIGLQLVDAVDVFRAIRDQGRDRVAALSTWEEGLVTFYRGTAPTRVEFPLDLDLASPMMAGTILRSKGEPRTLLPTDGKLVVPGPRFEAGKLPRERGAAPASLQYVMTFLPEQLPIDAALQRITDYRPGREARAVSPKEAAAALLVAELLGWAAWS